MKTLIAVALIATTAPAMAAFSPEEDGASRERRVCTQVTARAGSRMARRTCLTPTQWRERLGADWRQLLAGTPSIEDQRDAMQTRMGPPDNYSGQRGIPVGSPGRPAPGGPN